MRSLQPRVVYGLLILILLGLMAVVALLLRVLFSTSVQIVPEPQVAAVTPALPNLVGASSAPTTTTTVPPEPIRPTEVTEQRPDVVPEMPAGTVPAPIVAAAAPAAVPVEPVPPSVAAVPAPPARAAASIAALHTLPAGTDVIAQPALPAGAIGHVVELRGGALAYREQQVEQTYRTLSEGSSIKAAERLETWEDGRLQVSLSDGTQLHLGSRTAAIVDEYTVDPKNPAGNKVVVRLIEGDLRVIPGTAASSSADALTVRTRMTSTSPAGADLAYRSHLEGDSVTAVSVPPGRVAVVTTSRDGSPLMNAVTGESLPKEEAQLQRHELTAAGQQVVAPDGTPATKGDAGPAGVLGMAGATAAIPYSRYTAELGGTHSTIHIQREHMPATNTKGLP